MKLQEHPLSKTQTPKKPPKFIPLMILTFLLTIITVYFPFSVNQSSSLTLYVGNQNLEDTVKPTTLLDPAPKPDNPSYTWRRSRIDSGDAAFSQEQPKKQKPEETEITDTKPAQTDSSITKNSKTVENTTQPATMMGSKALDGKKCNLFTGEWIPNLEGPYYTNTTCNKIQEHQNCMKFGRPDTGFLKWRWKPDDCELPIFDPSRFLELVKGNSIGFIGDSVARNHMQSLICLLSTVAQPIDFAKPKDENRLYQYTEYDFNISIISSPYLIRAEKTDPNDFTRPYSLYLDEFDETWTTKIQAFDYVIISAGQWFFRPTYFYINRTLTGCLYCPETNITHLPSSFSYRWAFQTAFQAINGVENFTGVTFLRTFAPSHFEGGPWDKGGDCVRTRPFRRNETALEDYSLEMYMIQLEELRIAEEAGRRTGRKFRLFDATKAMLLRPDGHPSKYGRWPVANQASPNDCVHWCLPGPIDAWNDFLQELLKREVEKEL